MIEAAYVGSQHGKQRLLGLVEILLVLSLDDEGRLVSLLVRGGIELDLVLVLDLLHDLPKGGRLAIPTGSREVADGGCEGVRNESMLRHGRLNARSSTPRRGGRLAGSHGGEGRERLDRACVRGTVSNGRRLRLRRGFSQRRERVGCAFEFGVSPLQNTNIECEQNAV